MAAHDLVRGASRLLLLSLAMLPACGGPTVFLRRSPTPLTWPRESQARVEFVLAYHGSIDVELHPGFWSSLFSVFTGSERLELLAPSGVALATDDIVWIADPGHAAVHRLSLVTGEHKILAGSEAEPFEMPVGVAVAPDGRVFVTDSARGRVVTLAADGSTTGGFGTPASLGRPTGIAYDRSSKRLLVIDTIGCKIRALDLQGNELLCSGERGDKPGQFNFPTNVAIAADGSVVVVDSLNFRVQVLSPQLQPRSMFGIVGRGPGCFASPKGCAVDSENHVYVVDAMFDNVQIFDLAGQLLLAVGTHGTSLGEFELPTGICIDHGDRIVVADAGNARIQILQYLRSGK